MYSQQQSTSVSTAITDNNSTHFKDGFIDLISGTVGKYLLIFYLNLIIILTNILFNCCINFFYISVKHFFIFLIY